MWSATATVINAERNLTTGTQSTLLINGRQTKCRVFVTGQSFSESPGLCVLTPARNCMPVYSVFA